MRRFRRGFSSRSSFTTCRRLRYSQENGTYWLQVAGSTGDGSHSAVYLLARSLNLGVRKIKNIKLDMIADNNWPAFWAVIYIPEGMDPNPGLIVGAMAASASIYEPNQNVILYGVVDMTNPVHQFTRLARNLNGGDCVILVLQGIGDSTINVRGTVSYVVAYN
jgi:hypothetical protein